MRRAFAVIGAMLFSGLLLALAMPPGDIQALGWVCFVPLLAALRGARFIAACLAPIGTMFFAAWLTTTGWFYSWPKLEGEDAWHYSGYLLFGMALIPSFVAFSLAKSPSKWNVLCLGASFVAGESLLLSFLPAHLALTQYRSPAMLFASAWVGIWGVSLLLWVFQIWLANELTRPLSTNPKLALPLALITSISIWEHPEPAGPTHFSTERRQGLIRIGVVQSTEPDLTDPAIASQARAVGARLLVWPELSAIGLAAAGRTEKLRELSSSLEDLAFVTTFSDEAKPLPHNAASLFLAGLESDRYFKRRPFAAESGQHQAGTDAVAVPMGDLTVGLNICFDSCFPNLMRDTARLSGVDLLVLPCMGPESPYGVIQAIHGAFTPFRSAELGVPISRSESSAFAMSTDSTGRIVAQASPGYQGPLFGDIEPRAKWTLVKFAGDWVLYLCWLAVLAGATAGLRTKFALRKTPS